jgi:hypothetical protein
MNRDRTALSYWFPKIEAAGIPVPRTKIVHMPRAAQEAIWAAFDGKDAGDPKPFFAELTAAASEIGFPVFLRTDHTSGKHNWKRCCFVPSADVIPQHVFNLAEFSECVDLIGLPWDTWVVREFLPTTPVGTCPRYGGMPICREFRFFVVDGETRCWHCYWPRHALEEGGAAADLDYEAMSSLGAETERMLTDLANAAGRAVGGAWSTTCLRPGAAGTLPTWPRPLTRGTSGRTARTVSGSLTPELGRR